MSCHSKTTSAVLAASVMAVAAAVVSLASSFGADSTFQPAGVVSSTGSAGALAPPGSAGTVDDGGRRAGESSAPAGPKVLFVGRSPELRPRGGVTRSFACRAVARLGGTCQVREGAAPTVPAPAVADLVVVTLVPADDATQISRLLARLPAGLAAAHLVFLGPVTASTDPAAARRFAGVRRLAAARGAVVVDPVAAGWVSLRQRRTDLISDGGRLTPAGHLFVAGRLAEALRACWPADRVARISSVWGSSASCRSPDHA